jgi:hypothetical protein
MKLLLCYQIVTHISVSTFDFLKKVSFSTDQYSIDLISCPNNKIVVYPCKNWYFIIHNFTIPIMTVIRAMNLHYQVPSLNRLNQTEPVTFYRARRFSKNNPFYFFVIFTCYGGYIGDVWFIVKLGDGLNKMQTVFADNSSYLRLL